MLCKICNKNEIDNTSGICWQCVKFSKAKENLKLFQKGREKNKKVD
jgi:hypothetical protein